jgi:hypothetical protein
MRVGTRNRIQRNGPERSSIREAKRDAELLALELVEDVAQAVGPWLAQYGAAPIIGTKGKHRVGVEVEDDG